MHLSRYVTLHTPETTVYASLKRHGSNFFYIPCSMQFFLHPLFCILFSYIHTSSHGEIMSPWDFLCLFQFTSSQYTKYIFITVMFIPYQKPLECHSGRPGLHPLRKLSFTKYISGVQSIIKQNSRSVVFHLFIYSYVFLSFFFGYQCHHISAGPYEYVV